MVFGERKRIATNLTIPTAAPVAVAVPGTRGARQLVLAFSGGNNGNALSAMTVVGSWDGVTPVLIGPNLSLNPAATVIVTNGTDPVGPTPSAAHMIIMSSSAAAAIPTPFLIINPQAAVGDITGVEIDAWVGFDDENRSPHFV